MKKKDFGFFALVMFGLNLVSAAAQTQLGYNLARGMSQLIDIVESILEPLLYPLLGFGSGEFLFERILFLIIVLSVVYIALTKMGPFKENKAVVWIISIVVSILATRFLTDVELIQTIILPYTAVGVAISAIIPFLIYFWFVQTFDSSTMRKVLWTFYVVVFIAIWSERYDQIGSISWLYFWSAAAAFLFLLFDGTVRRLMVKAEMEVLDSENREKHLATLKKELAELRKDKAYYRESVFKSLERDLMSRIKRATKV